MTRSLFTAIGLSLASLGSIWAADPTPAAKPATEKRDILEQFVTEYHRRPMPDKVPEMLQRMFDEQRSHDEPIAQFQAQAFGHMARKEPKLIRTYEAAFAQQTKTRNQILLVKALMVCGDEKTLQLMSRWAKTVDDRKSKTPPKKIRIWDTETSRIVREAADHADLKTALKTARQFLADPKRKLPRDRVVVTPDDIYLLWGDFVVTGEYAPVARILDTLDRPDQIREPLLRWLKDNPDHKKDMLQHLKALKLLKPDGESLIDDDLGLALIHNRKGRYIESTYHYGLGLTDSTLEIPEEDNDLITRGAASWLVQNNIEEYPRLVEILKENYEKRPPKSQDLVKKWLGLAKPDVRLGKAALALQGAWQVTKWAEDGDTRTAEEREAINRIVKWTFKDDEFASTTAVSMSESEGEFQVPDGAPGTLKLLPYGDHDKIALYRLKGDELVICMGKKGKTPAEFTAKKGSGQILITFKRVAK
jgi:uncharacterized protein (TIGR03067 family)